VHLFREWERNKEAKLRAEKKGIYCFFNTYQKRKSSRFQGEVILQQPRRVPVGQFTILENNRRSGFDYRLICDAILDIPYNDDSRVGLK